MAGTYVYGYLGRPAEEDEDMGPLSDEEKQSRWLRIKGRFSALYRYFAEPAWEQLLPDPLPEPYGRKHTLVINLDETLIYSTWDRQSGWRIAKRPGVDEFLAYMSRYYEIVLFTSQPSLNAQPIVEKLDPLQFISYSLYKEATKYVNGQVLKDLSHLNRDLSKVIQMDSNPVAYSLQPDNALAVPPWKGDPSDRWLINMIPFLEAIVINDVDDVRPVCRHYAGKDIPKEFAQWEREQEEEARIKWEKRHSSKRNLSSLFGGSSSSSSSKGPPLPYYQQKRLQMRAAFAQEHEQMVKEATAMNKAFQEEQEKALKDMNLTVWDLITKGVPPPPTPGNPAPSSS
ncbi:MAG: HAD-like domain-containing protein [Piptocephalis tieghemiana]|nr:MAG: HAD-like domain-containing protein [Piptocephalis tieghemiana]